MTQSSQPGIQPKFTNRLVHETSPYLRQHAHNPVDWYPWGNEALEKSRKLDKPILLSIGYSACHWCHVMERESFENESIANIMNELFVNIKVDREERPDLDTMYMNYVQMSTGSGGWPMTVFLTPDQVPFFGGTYFPPDDRYGRPGFPRLCIAVNEAYRKRKEDIVASGSDVIEALNKLNKITGGGGLRGVETVTQAYQNLSQRFDWVNGGFEGAPKFPPSMSLAFCLRYFLRKQERSALDFVELTLDKMASGGMYDQLGGGFHRYSVDERWLVPHFEKMLYDNALLSRIYLEAFQLTGKQRYRQIVEEVLEYVKREMTDPQGGFYSSQDADSEGEEGKYFVWVPEEVVGVLGKELAELFCSYYDVTRKGNFEGRNILHVPRPLEDIARETNVLPKDITAKLDAGRRLLLNHREKRIRPHRDEKILSSWNGLMLVGFALAGRILNRGDFLQSARENASFILQRMTRSGKLYRIYKDGQARIPGYLDDYSHFIEGLLTLYEVTGESNWLEQALNLTDEMLRQFWDSSESSFFLAGNEHEKLITKVRDFYDNATPAGSSVAVLNLLRLSSLTGKLEYQKIAQSNLDSMETVLSQHPGGFSYMLQGVDFLVGPVKEFAVVGDQGDPRTRKLVDTIFREFLPNKILGYATGRTPAKDNSIPLLRGRNLVDGGPAVYVCEDFVCRSPVTSQEQLEKLIKGFTV